MTNEQPGCFRSTWLLVVETRFTITIQSVRLFTGGCREPDVEERTPALLCRSGLGIHCGSVSENCCGGYVPCIRRGVNGCVTGWGAGGRCGNGSAPLYEIGWLLDMGGDVGRICRASSRRLISVRSRQDSGTLNGTPIEWRSRAILRSLSARITRCPYALTWPRRERRSAIRFRLPARGKRAP